MKFRNQNPQSQISETNPPDIMSGVVLCMHSMFAPVRPHSVRIKLLDQIQTKKKLIELFERLQLNVNKRSNSNSIVSAHLIICAVVARIKCMIINPLFVLSRGTTVPLQHVRENIFAINNTKSPRKDTLSQVCSQVPVAQPSRNKRRAAKLVPEPRVVAAMVVFPITRMALDNNTHDIIVIKLLLLPT